jgi:pimeloyl-ACP methyl ester carboxylesterase
MQIPANGIALEIDDQGPPAGEAVVLIQGLGMQLIDWPDTLVRQLTAQGLRVIRFDNRDVGLSRHFDELGLPNLMLLGAKHFMHLPQHVPYTLRDMAADVIGLLDALGIARAHICGASLGGMVAQHLAAEWPERVRSLTLVMTTSGARHLPHAQADAQRVLMARSPSQTTEGRAEHLLHVFDVLGSPGYRPEPGALRSHLLRKVQRSWHPAGVVRQLAAVMADGDRTPLLGRIQAPTQILHGEADPLVPVAAAHDLARHIPGAVLETVPGMGHDFPEALMPRFAQAIQAAAARAR